MSFSRTPHLRRVKLDDSSDESMMNASSAYAGDASMLSAVPVDIGNLTQGLEEMIILEPSQGEVSRSFEDSRPEHELEQGPSSEPDVSDSEASEEDPEDDPNEYVYDSFCVEDSENERESESYSDSDDSDDEEGDDDVFEEPMETPSRHQPLRSCRQPLFHSTPVQPERRQSPKRKDNVQEVGGNEDLYRELYPELFDENGMLKVNLSQHETDPDENTEFIKLDVELPKEADESAESLDIFLNKIRQNKNDDGDVSYDSLDDRNFIVNDSDLSEEEPSGSENSELILTDDEGSDEDGDDNEWERERKKSREEAKKKHLIEDELFLISLSENYNGKYGKAHPDAAAFVRKKLTKSTREKLCPILYSIYNKRCFDSQLPSDLKITWNPRMLTTAGFAKCRYSADKKTRSARIELAPKVCTTAERTRDTLLHEMCHVAVFLIDERDREKHGPVWKKWAVHCHSTFHTLPFVTRCHNYAIEKKYTYVCDGCGSTVHRHSKSLDVTRNRCGICHGKFALQVDPEKSVRAPSKFALFVKEHYHVEKRRGWKHGAIMRLLSERFKKMSASEVAMSPLDVGKKDSAASQRTFSKPAIEEVILCD
ncbi:hypothetical protein QR680_013106 [Steinernema hermaphroditum]|uniref:SprT-like domain-containing protein n=1 Tax=Steinernema hermaphroditum TaxID=289476 RepID=A0AA39I603_9BILA|nr:hypothetical protein QR680_013106 [Steinernema hermaphroditum]